MDQYQEMNAIEKIEGYLLPQPGESLPTAFDRAKAECLTRLRAQIEHVESITADKFASGIE